MNSLEHAREAMIRQQLRTVGVLNDRILDVIRHTPRENFVPSDYRGFAYADTVIPLAHGQQMLLPQDEGLMLQALELKASDNVLEIGTGTGYFTALLAQLASHVTSVDIYQDFVDGAKSHEFCKNLTNITFQCADGAKGPSGMEAYDAIVITGAFEYLPDSYLQALKPYGRLVAIIGEVPAMYARLITKKNNELTESILFETVTPYLVNAPHQNGFKF